MTASILPCRLQDLTYRVGDQALLAGVTFDLAAGPRSIILGPNGAGKSLLLRLLHGLIAPSAGRIDWQGSNPRDRQAMVFQRPVMLRRSAAANLDFALALRGHNQAARKERRDAVLARTGLQALAGRPARVLSFGEQQRLALARAWALEPDVIFLDEPTASLDPAATKAVEDIITEMHQSGTKVVMTTHDLGQARRLADEVLFLHQGRLVTRQPADEFFAAPNSPEATAFLEGRLVW